MRELPPAIAAAARRAGIALGRKGPLVRAAGVRPSGRSKLQASYADELELLRRAGELLWFAEEGMKLRLADRTWYRPDFLLQRRDGRLEVHEVKGHRELMGRVKLKVSAELNPWARFYEVRRLRGSWVLEEIPGPRPIR